MEDLLDLTTYQRNSWKTAERELMKNALLAQALLHGTRGPLLPRGDVKMPRTQQGEIRGNQTDQAASKKGEDSTTTITARSTNTPLATKKKRSSKLW